MNVELAKEKLAALVQAEDVASLSCRDIFELVTSETSLHDFLPDSVYRIDPRDGAVVLFNSARAKRPHHHPQEKNAQQEKQCPVCAGNTTGIIDVTPLSEGFTFINKNLFPMLYPAEEGGCPDADGNGDCRTAAAQTACGLHLLQWTSSFHSRDWHNMPLEDRVTVLERLAALEKKLLYDSAGLMPAAGEDGSHGYVSVIKNHGAPVGGSLVHGHQQIAYSNVIPQRFQLDLTYKQRTGETFSDTLLRETPKTLRIRDYEKAELVVPWFMKRPYCMILALKDTSKKHLCDLEKSEITAVADGLHDAVRALLAIMPGIGRTPAYNITLNNGPGAGLYFEFLPFTQETGGFEQLGLWICQNNPETAAVELRNFLNK